MLFLLIMSFWDGIGSWLYDVNYKIVQAEKVSWLLAFLIGCYVVLIGHVIWKFHKFHCHFRWKLIPPVLLVVAIYISIRSDDNFVFYHLPTVKIAWTDILVALGVFDSFIRPIQKKITVAQPEKSLTQKTLQYILDRPISDEKEDLMKYSQIANHIYGDLEDTDVSRHSFSLGVIGHWGQGKSSLINMLKSCIQKDKRNIIVEFNPRNSSNIEEIQGEFFDVMCKAVSPYSRNLKIKFSGYIKKLRNIQNSFNIINLLTIFIPIATKSEVGDSIRESKLKFFIIIDDFDRLTAPEILEVLKIIGTNADFPNTYFITAFDKNYVDGVMSKYLGTDKKNFSNKYFDYEYMLPIVNNTNMFSYAEGVFENLRKQNINTSVLDALEETWRRERTQICSYFDSIRDIKRFLNLFLSRYILISDDIDAQDYMYLTLLRYKDLNAYNALSNGEFTHRLKLSNDSANPDAAPNLFCLVNNIANIVKNGGYWDETIKILEKLFPKTALKSYSKLKDYYRSIQFPRNEKIYFYDFQSLQARYEDLERMKNAADDDSAKAEIDKLAVNNQIDVKLYLTYEFQNFETDKEVFSRLIVLSLEYLALFPNDDNFVSSLANLFGSSFVKRLNQYFEFKSLDEYKAFWEEKIKELQQVYPYELQRILKQKYDNQNIIDKQVVFTSQELHGYLLDLQQLYFNAIKGKENNLKHVFEASLIYAIPENISYTPLSENVIDRQAAKNLRAEMYASSSSYVERIIEIQNENHQLVVWLDENYCKICKGYEKKFNDWVDNLQFQEERDIIHWLSDETDNTITISYEIEKIPTLRKLHELIKSYYLVKDEENVLKALRNEHNYDLYHVRQWVKEECHTSIHNDLISIMQNLFGAGKIKDNRLNMKERMVPFEKHDFVKLDKDIMLELEYSGIAIWEVKSLDRDKMTLTGLGARTILPEVTVSKDKILPVPINGKDDNNIYYDPMIAAPTGDNTPPQKRDRRYYYTVLREDKTLWKQISDAKCLYVHEVQHILRRESLHEALKVL